MTEILIGGDVKKMEASCNKKLGAFVGKLNQYSNILKNNSMELKQIARDLVIKSQQFQKLENIKWVSLVDLNFFIRKIWRRFLTYFQYFELQTWEFKVLFGGSTRQYFIRNSVPSQYSSYHSESINVSISQRIIFFVK